MRKQIINRLGVADIRNTVATFCKGTLSSDQACEALEIGKTRLYQLRSDFLLAKASGKTSQWVPKSSGGNHMPLWSDDVQNFLKKALSHHYSYAFAASEVLRLFHQKLDRAQVRHWAQLQGFVPPVPKPRPPAHVRRWQRSYIHLFYNAFMQFGLPLQIYVDQASFFRSDSPERQTQLAQRLKFYDISFLLANSPEAKGKVERIHQVWQSRLPSYFKLNSMCPDTPLSTLNQHLEALRIHRNSHQLHREINQTPLHACNRALKDHRTKLRPVPRDPWWEYVWAEWASALVGPRGHILLGNLDIPTQVHNGTRVWVYYHINGSFSILSNKPSHSSFPSVLFSSKTL